MIQSVTILTTPMAPGEERDLVAFATAPMTIAILCYTSHPPPAGFKPCPECGSFSLTNGVAYKIKATASQFLNVGGELRLTVTDTTGDGWTATITVTP
jgi:hypothetical protein